MGGDIPVFGWKTGTSSSFFNQKNENMIRRLLLAVCLCSGVLCVAAQDKFVEKLTKVVGGQGTIRVFQDAEITRLVNGTSPLGGHTASETVIHKPDGGHGDRDTTASSANKSITRKVKAQGYRIQVYAGGNSRTARQEARNMAVKVKRFFDDIPVYTLYKNPRWICRVGDFRTYEEATQVLHELNATDQFAEAMIVKSEILISY